MLTLAMLAVVTLAQDSATFHVKSVHKETPDEHGRDKGSLFSYLKMIGTFNGKTYTVEAMDAGWTKSLEVGKDYPATLKKGAIVTESTYKGKMEKIRWTILTVEE